MNGFSVAVLISAGRHPVSGAPRACRGDVAAMAMGKSLVGDELRVIHAGKRDEPSLQDYMAYGAGTIDVIELAAESDVCSALASSLGEVDLILTGGRAEQGLGSGLLPYLLADALRRPVLANVIDAKIEDGGAGAFEARVRQFLPKGQRRRIAGPLPLVIAVHPIAASQLKYAYARRVSGRTEILSDLSASNRAVGPNWTVEMVPRRPVRLRAQDKKSAHARLLSAIVSETKGGVVAFEGTVVDKAQVVLNYLREHRLVEF
ncbi:MAG: electron transfer flavoprotein subunit beta/FixA family protein [Proteobacteria bacterium]|nr:electron transfer flavoprotein subunit beta/FixA family protein [Pseudomonadota bacterium]